MNTICGHDREAVLWALVNYETAVVHRPAHGIEGAPRKARERIEAHEAVSDPAKLAELMAEELRRRGVIALATRNDDFWDAWNSIPEIPQCMVIWNDTRIHIHKVVRVGTSDVWPLEMTQARAALLRILQLSEDTPVADVLKALEVPS